MDSDGSGESHPIKTAKQYKRAVRRLAEMFNDDIPDFDAFSELACRIDEYEEKHFPLGLSKAS